MAEESPKTEQVDLKRAASAWAPVLAYMAIIFVLSAQSKLPELPMPILSWDKAQHLAAYLGLALVAFRAANLMPIAARPGSYVQSFILAALYGASDEFHQKFVAGRSAQVGDWLADALGAALALVILAVISKCSANGGRRLGKAQRG